MFSAALVCARRGARPRRERPGRHPRLPRGLTEASTDPRRLDLWWPTWSDANVGLRTGEVMDVVDIDTEEGSHALAHLTRDRAPPGRSQAPAPGCTCGYASLG
jgi:hypothetical protein